MYFCCFFSPQFHFHIHLSTVSLLFNKHICDKEIIQLITEHKNGPLNPYIEQF